VLERRGSGDRRNIALCSQLFSNYFSGSGEHGQRLMKDRWIFEGPLESLCAPREVLH